MAIIEFQFFPNSNLVSEPGSLSLSPLSLTFSLCELSLSFLLAARAPSSLLLPCPRSTSPPLSLPAPPSSSRREPYLLVIPPPLRDPSRREPLLLCASPLPPRASPLPSRALPPLREPLFLMPPLSPSRALPPLFRCISSSPSDLSAASPPLREPLLLAPPLRDPSPRRQTTPYYSSLPSSLPSARINPSLQKLFPAAASPAALSLFLTVVAALSIFCIAMASAPHDYLPVMDIKLSGVENFSD